MDYHQRTAFCLLPVILAGCLLPLTAGSAGAAEPAAAETNLPAEVQKWLVPQEWTRDIDGPVLSLGEGDAFDNRHMFGPCVAQAGDRFMLWYAGSQGEVGNRVFRMGLATGTDGRHFTRHPESPVYEFGDGKHSILTPTLLRETTGEPIRENGRLRMWFSSTWFEGASSLHTLHETTSTDGVEWAEPSKPQLENVYAPSVLKVGDGYRMWYTDVSAEPWVFRHASSTDGRTWNVTEEPVLALTQKWESGRLFYPCVIQEGGVFLMWYGSYWSAERAKTALGFAVSTDGITWHKHPQNPVLRPDPTRPWESHYNTSQSVIRLDDGSYRMWYASRKKPPFVNKYFAIGTARWDGPLTPAAEQGGSNRR
jgi:predicted GH43/DUF377 family glycosyl hydrolase